MIGHLGRELREETLYCWVLYSSGVGRVVLVLEGRFISIQDAGGL
jgi:hypothetical protein